MTMNLNSLSQLHPLFLAVLLVCFGVSRGDAAGTFTPLGHFRGGNANIPGISPLSVSDDGRLIVGWSNPPAWNWSPNAFRWTPEHGFVMSFVDDRMGSADGSVIVGADRFHQHPFRESRLCQKTG